MTVVNYNFTLFKQKYFYGKRFENWMLNLSIEFNIICINYCYISFMKVIQYNAYNP